MEYGFLKPFFQGNGSKGSVCKTVSRNRTPHDSSTFQKLPNAAQQHLWFILPRRRRPLKLRANTCDRNPIPLALACTTRQHTTVNDNGYYTIKGFPASCHKCGHKQFNLLKVPVNRTLFDEPSPPLEDSVDHLQCRQCHHVHRFIKELVKSCDTPDDASPFI
jgi:hypothetical protein